MATKPKATPEPTTPGTIKEGEYHPAADSAFAYLKAVILADPMTLEAIFSTALSGNRMAEIVAETLQRIMGGQPVSDRYVLGAAWFIKDLKEVQQ